MKAINRSCRKVKATRKGRNKCNDRMGSNEDKNESEENVQVKKEFSRADRRG